MLNPTQAQKTIHPIHSLSAKAMAAKMLLSPHSHPHPHPLSSLPFQPNKYKLLHHPWQWHQHPPRPKKLRVSLLHDIITTHQHQLLLNPNSLFLLTETASGGYSLASYYTSLGLFVISVPGLWSLIKRSVKSKVIHIIYFVFFILFIFGFFLLLLLLSLVCVCL